MILWYCLTPECQERLAAFQRRRYKSHLQLPQFEPGLVTAPLESTEEIGKIMALPAGDHRLRDE
jgi:hypothetical protein